MSGDISDENYDFEDINASKKESSRREKYSDRSAKDTSKLTSSNEAQEVAESASFVNNRNNYHTGFKYQQPIYVVDQEPVSSSEAPQTASSSSEFTGYNYRQPATKKGRKIEHRDTEQWNRDNLAGRKTTVVPSTHSRRGTTTFQNQNSRQQRNDFIASAQQFTTPNSLNTIEISKKANTARRLHTSRTTPYYTPTVPSIINRPSTLQQLTSANPIDTSVTTENTPSSEHAIEMIRTLQELNLDAPLATAETERNIVSQRLAESILPPSSGPDTLHSLALYFATAVDNLVTKSETTTNEPKLRTEKSLDVLVGNVTDVSAALLSNKTINKYEKLFGFDEKNPVVQVNASSPVSRSDEFETRFTSADNDLDTDYSVNPILAAAGTPQIRELAQVFTHALSAYLHDPSTFRRVLSEIRPTEPTPTHTDDILTNRIGRTEDFNKGTGATYLPTLNSAAPTTPPQTFVSTTEDLEVLDFSDVTVSTHKKESIYPSTTPYPLQPETTTNQYYSTADTIETTTTAFSRNLKYADKIPASRLLTEGLEKIANTREPKSFEGTTETNNPFAMEINGGLIISTSFPYFQDDSLESTNQTFEETNYFPIDSAENAKQNFTEGLYGKDSRVRGKPLTSSTVDINSVPLNWGSGEDSTDRFTATTTAEPPAISFELLPPSSQRQGFKLPSYDIIAPTADDSNDLQRAQSQSIAASGNQLFKQQLTVNDNGSKVVAESTTDDLQNVKGHYITQTLVPTPSPSDQKTTLPDTGKFSPNPWSTLAYTVFLDPLTINDGLMNSHELNTVTPSPNTYLPRSTQTPSYSETSTTAYNSYSTVNARQGKSSTTEPEQVAEYMEVMQKKANEMFGTLNDTSASHLMNVMKKANKNKTVRKLILLLIQTCDDDYNTTVEESRTALLNALIGMDGKLDEDSELQVISSRTNQRTGKSIELNHRFNAVPIAPSTTPTPITTYRRPHFYVTSTTLSPQYLFESTSTLPPETDSTTITTTISHETTKQQDNFDEGNFKTSAEQQTTAVPTVIYSTTFEPVTTETTTFPTTHTIETTKKQQPTTVTTARPILSTTKQQPTQRTSQSRRIAKDLDDFLGQSSLTIDPNASRAHKHSDTRALDLLRSLYSLAGKFGKR